MACGNRGVWVRPEAAPVRAVLWLSQEARLDFEHVTGVQLFVPPESHVCL